VLLVGAGASEPLALPDTRQLLSRLTDLGRSLHPLLEEIVRAHKDGRPDAEWVLDRVHMYETLDGLLSDDSNLHAEVERTLNDVVKRCREAAEWIRAAFPEYEYLTVYPTVANSLLGTERTWQQVTAPLTDIQFRGTILPATAGDVAAPYTHLTTGLSGVVEAASEPPARVGGETYRAVKAPPFEPVLDIGTAASRVFSELATEGRRLREAIYDNIVRIYGRIDPQSAQELYEPLVAALYGLAKANGGRGLSVFTTNWDPAFDALQERSSLPLEVGLQGGPYERCWDPSCYREGTINVYRLHGRCRWARLKDTPDRIVQTPFPTRGDPAYDVPVLFPGRTKSDYISEEPFATAYAALEAATTMPAVWVVVGYSFRDEGVQSKIERALVRGNLRRMIVLDRVSQLRLPKEIRASTTHVHGRFGDPQALARLLKSVARALQPRR
jgi:hypothetical protein